MFLVRRNILFGVKPLARAFFLGDSCRFLFSCLMNEEVSLSVARRFRVVIAERFSFFFSRTTPSPCFRRQVVTHMGSLVQCEESEIFSFTVLFFDPVERVGGGGASRRVTSEILLFLAPVPLTTTKFTFLFQLPSSYILAGAVRKIIHSVCHAAHSR